ncbi:MULTISPECIES: host cell division inhibitor Icd-like protein [Enterobacterales]|uniref:Host cell division inhibitor Icd-like protein n=1 Tax=Edwardsiella anguillarum TaxID=1821960 RepID=A0ABY8SC34_9GAMM|nr:MULTISPECIES: host cell division inhibitor Icd-like protein [Enterobacterales]AKR78645.1 host cell division inhibitor Icd-like protein [Edwardsiella sp. LADL05-105]KAB0586756.1 ash family protein [Edwardsiella anguillarum]WHP79595.1 host cell division inhibitor Icd-like protein [Edwardsiella anguillarum]WHP83205.1 host cell division inhibitor Icd-like protein [Edwardsiella anguillarum]WHP86999.1 host cell division inhibitor Icd-like protein [Edwardsiella anguillarum]
MMMTVQQTAPFSGLLLFAVSRYSFPAVAKSAAGRRNPCLTMATPDAPCVFFCVCALMHPFNTQWPFRHCGYRVMVAQAGQLSGWPVLIVTGIPTPVWATTHERRNSGGSCNQLTMEVALMATTLTPSHPQFVFVFAAVRRADRTPRICMLRTVAGDEHAARLSLVRDYVLSFAGRLPVAEVRA